MRVRSAWWKFSRRLWAHTFSRTSGLRNPTLSLTPSSISGQEILVADSADHSATKQTDTTFCPNQESAEWKETIICCSSWRKESRRGCWELTLWSNPSSPPRYPAPICVVFFIPYCFRLCQSVADPAWLNMPSSQANGWEGQLEETVCARKATSLWSRVFANWA